MILNKKQNHHYFYSILLGIVFSFYYIYPKIRDKTRGCTGGITRGHLNPVKNN